MKISDYCSEYTDSNSVCECGHPHYMHLDGVCYHKECNCIAFTKDDSVTDEVEESSIDNE